VGNSARAIEKTVGTDVADWIERNTHAKDDATWCCWDLMHPSTLNVECQPKHACCPPSLIEDVGVPSVAPRNLHSASLLVGRVHDIHTQASGTCLDITSCRLHLLPGSKHQVKILFRGNLPRGLRSHRATARVPQVPCNASGTIVGTACVRATSCPRHTLEQQCVQSFLLSLRDSEDNAASRSSGSLALGIEGAMCGRKIVPALRHCVPSHRQHEGVAEPQLRLPSAIQIDIKYSII
jgi:hypothetical protein